MYDIAALAAALQSGNRRALAKAITLIESTRIEDEEQAQELLNKLLPYTGTSRRIGVTGVPGVGKSTFIEAFGLMLIAQGLKVAVLAIDPSSERTGGSILGDKTRMLELSRSHAAFIRPSPAGTALGGVARRTRETMLLCEAAGFNVVLIETVGVGQSETAVASMVDFFLVLALAGAGDELQGMKRGIMELADAVVITKAEEPHMQAAQRAAQHIRNALHYAAPKYEDWNVPVMLCSAVERTGLEDIWQTIQQFCAHTQRLEHIRSAQSLRWMQAVVRDGIQRIIERNQELQTLQHELEDRVRAHILSPTLAALRLLQAIEQRIQWYQNCSEADHIPVQ
ncbi:MAG: methylmalonyl Co-A mutase-associated GTPase MeaB [Bacteroidota bacterium]|nr:methylmalonyl Co-A mutase-associated GTPase MeaB [Candidatus Kapabacteria bacterium]MDW8220505.1 methylmalonyl Co-A mutase-associated GTPase MeaB [Bacteroidota bacterium]